MLALNDLSIRIGGRLLIEDASVQLPERGRVGLVGRNGTGKSTLLKAILGKVAVESGEIKHAATLGSEPWRKKRPRAHKRRWITS